jgi:hypothetical protein
VSEAQNSSVYFCAYSHHSHLDKTRAFFLGGRRCTRTPKHFVNLTGESKNFKLLVFPLNKLQTLSLTAFIFSDLNYKIVIFLSQTESNPKHFLGKKHWKKLIKKLIIYMQEMFMLMKKRGGTLFNY